MDFRTELVLKPSPFKIDLKDPVLTMGSCFAQSIGQKILENKFQTVVNPFGTTYHPLAIHKLLNYAVYHEYPPAHTYLENNGVHFNYDFHSHFHGEDQAQLQKQVQECIASIHYFLKNCKVLLLTYGTSFLYERVDTGEAVANCHKIASSSFTRRMTSLDEIKESFNATFKALTSVNPSLESS